MLHRGWAVLGGSTVVTITDKRNLSFGALLAELQDFIGRRIVIESVDHAGRIYHQSEGVLARTVDNHLDLRGDPGRPAIIAFQLDAGGCFMLHKCEFAGASTFLVRGLGDDADTRVVKIARGGEGALVVRDAWERELLDRVGDEIVEFE